jgi:hypothetical protein
MEEDPPAGPSAVVITWRTIPAICAVACAVLLVIALANISHGSGWILWGAVAVFFAAGALSGFRRRYELTQEHLVIRRVFTRHTIILSELTSVEAVPMNASQGRRYWHLVLEDREGTRVRLSFLHTAPDVRQEFLTALTPFALAPGVHLGGPIGDALAGRLW